MLPLCLVLALQLLAADGRGLQSLTTRQRSELEYAGFLRDSVESQPAHDLLADVERGGGHRSSLRSPEFGSRALPLRAAVERKPSPRDRAHSHYPLRDAVERRPTPVDEIARLRDHGVRPTPPPSQHRQSPVMVFAPPAGWPHSVVDPLLAASGMDWWRRRGPVVRLPSPSLGTAQHLVLPPLQPQQRWGLIANPNYVFNAVRREPSVMTYQAPKSDDSAQKKVVCYLEAWAAYRKDVVAYSADNVDPFACTHVIYAFAAIDPHTFRMEPQDEEYDLVKGGYRAAVGLKRKNPNLKVMLSVGGWMEGSSKFSQMASQANRRREFIRSVVKTLELYKFDGLDLDWEYPGALDLGGQASDKGHFSLLVDELSEVFRTRGWLLSAAVSPSRFRIEDAYDIPRISQNLDLINLMAFDLHAERDSAADHHAPLHSRPHDASIDIFYNVDYAVKYWMKKGAPAQKLVLGVPFYGRSFTLRDTTQATPGSPIKGLGKEGRYTQEKGFLSFLEICELQSEGGWRQAVDRAGSPFMVKGDQWVGYEDPHSIAIKMSYIRKQNLAGVMVWAIDLDDFKGLCGEKTPLLTAVRKNINEEQSVYAPTQVQVQAQTEVSSGSVGPGPSAPAPLLAGKPSSAPSPSPGPTKPVEQGASSPSPPNPSPSSNPPPEPGLAVSIDKNSMVCNGTGYAKDPEDCNVYYICDWNVKTTYVCPEPLHFNSKLSLCDWPENAGCVNKTEGSKTNKHAVNDEVAKVCDLRNGAASDPEDCSRYYWCAGGRAYRLRCAHGQFFHAVSGFCLPGNPRDICQDHHFQTLGLTGMQRIAVPSTKQLIGEDNYKVICYFTSWASYRKKEGKFVPEHMDPRLCTHIVYAFASLDPESLTVQPFDPWADIENNFYDRITALPDPRHGRGDQLKVILSMGGWTDSTGSKYSELVNSKDKRHNFVQNAVAFLRRHNFRGLQIDWNYPKCWHSDCSKGPASDKPNFTALIKELHVAFSKEKPPLVVAVGLSGYKDIIDNAYELQELSKYVDYFSAMTYDYHGSWEGKLGHVSPLYYRDGDRNKYYNTNSTLEYLVSKGAARHKLMAGIPFYGQSFSLKSKGSTALGDPSAGPGDAGELTSQPGMLAYYEICDRVRNKMWTEGRDSKGATGPYAFSEDQWVSYDDVSSIKAKSRFIKNMGFGGAVAWTVDLDDFENRCCFEPFPLLRAINRVLGRLTEDEPTHGDCTKPPTPVTPASPTMTTAVDAGDGQYKPSTPSTTWPTWTEGQSTTSTTSTPSTTTWPGWKPPSSTEMLSSTTDRPSWTTNTTASTSSTAQPSTSSTTEMPSVTIASPIPPPPPPPPPPATHPPMAGDGCQGGEYLPDPTNCNAYYRCTLGELKKQNCAAGLHWNSNTKVCDWPSESSCSDHGSETQSTSSSTTTSTSAPSSASPTSSSTKTTSSITSSTSTSTVSSTINEWWTHAPTTERPDQWWTHPSTQTTGSTSSSTTTEKMPPAGAHPTSEAPQQDCMNGQYSSHNSSCEKFYICVNGHQVEQQCAVGLVWNPESSMCDWKFNVKCRVVNDDLVVRGGEGCKVGEFRSHINCGQYYVCVHGELQAFSCAPGLQWNKEKQTCDWPTDSECEGASVITETQGAGSGSGGSGSESGAGEDTTSKPSSTTKNPWIWEPEIVTPKPIVDNEPLTPLSGYFKIVCYFTNWAWYRQGAGKYLPEHINPNLCTHIVYGFAVLDYENLVLKAHDSWADFDNKFYDRVVALKKKGKKVSLALGGWNDSAGDKYSRLVNNPNSRRRFIKHALEFLARYNFDGLDLDWEYPKCWQVNCDKGPDSDKAAFGAFVRELREAFTAHNLLLSSAVSPSKTVIDAGYDVPALADSLDWVAVMTYDFHGQWDKKTGHVAPMYFHPDDDFYFFNANYSINYWIEKGVPRRKIVMGMPLYGQSFQLAEASTNGLNARAPGPGQAGEFTRAAGFLAYYEICDRVKNRGWTVVKDPKKRMGPYAFQGNQWVSYDDADMIRLKSQYIRDNNLGGGMIWALDLDDFRNNCGEGIHPLLKIIRKTLGPAPGYTEGEKPEATTSGAVEEKPEMGSGNTSGQPQATTSTPEGADKPDEGNKKPETQPSPSKPEGETEGSSEMKPSKPEGETPVDSEYKVVCYFTNWAWYRQELGKYLPSDIDPDLCTHIVYGFAVLDGDQLVIKPHDSWADIDNNFYEKVTALKKKGIKVTIAIGGWNDSAGDKYSRLANNPEARARFIKHVTEFIEKYNFDGLDLDWEYPKCWQVNCKQGPDSDKEGFAALVRELREAFRPKGLLLSSAVSPNKAVIDAGYDVPIINENLDWIAVMAYDYHGQWDKKTGHVAPMYVHPEDVDATFNTNFTIHYWLSQGADPKKLVLGMPMYGQSFSLADNSNHGLNAPTYGGGEAGDFTRARGFLSYYEICHNIQKKGWKVVQDPNGAMGPYAYLRDQWVSYDDIDMIRYKSEWVKKMGLGGGMIWALDLDDFTNRCHCETYPLLKTINRVLRNYPKPDPKCSLLTDTDRDGETNTVDTSGGSVSVESAGVSSGKQCEGNLFKPHEENCNKYYTCVFGELQLQSCPDNLYWSVDHCDWPENSKCTVSSGPDKIPTTTPSSVTTSTSTTPASAPAHEMTTEVEASSSPRPDTDRSGYKVVCYFTNWAWYRQGIGKYTPEDIDSDLCTHITYGFAVLDGSTLTIKPHDTWADIDNDFYKKVVANKKKGIKVSIAIGGWNDSLGDKYSRLVNDPNARRRFIENLVEFIEKYEFDGLDLDWEYPKCWQVNCNLGPESDKEGFAALVRELSAEFKPRKWLLSSAVSPSKLVIDQGYDVPTLSEHFDWIAVMTYDFHGHWDKQTGHVAPLYYVPGDTFDYFNANFTMHYWIAKGADPKKLVMGMPMYGQSFALADSADHGLNAKSYGPGEAGEFTRAGGFLAYYEICDNVKRKGWTVERDPEGRIGPYAYRDNQWVSYDDVDDIRRKSRFIKDMGLAGGMIWALDLDDFQNRCGCGQHPLLKTINQELRGLSHSTTNCT